MPFQPLKDAVSPDSPKRVVVTDDQGQLLDGSIRQMVWSTASLAWIRGQQSVLSTDNLTVTSTITSMPTVNVGNAVAVTQSGAWGVTATVNIGTTLPAFASAPTFNVGNIPAFTQSGGPWTTVGSVWVSSLPSVNIGNIPAVSQSGAWTSTSTVNIGSTLPAFAAVPTVWVGSIPSFNGIVTALGSGKTLKTLPFSLSATGTVASSVSAKRIKVYAVKLVASAALSVNFRDGASTALEGAQSLAINGGFVESVNPPEFLFATTASLNLDLAITGIGTAAGRISYWDDDAT